MLSPLLLRKDVPKVCFFFFVSVCFPLTVSGSWVILCINQPTCLLLVWTRNLNSRIKNPTEVSTIIA